MEGVKKGKLGLPRRAAERIGNGVEGAVHAGEIGATIRLILLSAN
jgi:hypothetical protein